MAEFGDTVDFGKTMLKIIETEYESVFSWHIKERTGDKQNLLMNFLDAIREKCDSFVTEKDVFNMNRFYYQLIIVYEIYVLGDLKKSLQEAELIIKSIDSCKFDEMNSQYLDAYKHIACSTFAYIALSMNCYSQKNIENVKPINSLNQAEKSAICAVKSCVFMEYAPNGNTIALKLADEARNLYSKEPHWILIWLKAKGRCRRFNNIGKSMPDRDEIEAADTLSSQINPKPQFLINACKIYHDVAFYNRIINDKEKSQMYFKLGSDLLIDASKLIDNDVKEMYSCLFAFLFTPKEFQSKTAIEQMVKKLKTVNNNASTNDVLGEYYFKYEKDYEKAKMYFSRGLSFGQFRCAMQLLKVECHLNPIDSFPYIKTLKMIYEVFPSPKRRLIILTQMILYYYDTENPKELMYTLKLFLDQDIENEIKKLQLISGQSFYNLRKEVKHDQFLNVLTDYVDCIRKNVEWNAEEKILVDETCTLFSKISNFKTYRNQFNKNCTKNFHQQCYEWRSEKKYSPNSYLQNDKTRNNETSWRKKKENDNESAVCNPFIKSANKTHEIHLSQKNKITRYQKEKSVDTVNELIVKRFNKDLTICNSSTTKANGFENQNGHLNEQYSNLHVPNSKSDSLLYKAETKELNKKNRFQSKRRQRAIKKKSQEQDKKGLFTINSNVHSSSSPSHLEVRNKIIYRSNNQDTMVKDKYNFVTNKLNQQFQPDRNLYYQTKLP